MSEHSRRTVVRGAAWSVPVIAVAAQAPAFATSTDPLSGPVTGSKCPGNSVPLARNGVVLTFQARSAADATAIADGFPGTITSVVVNGVSQDVRDVDANGSLVYVLTSDRGNSSQSSGSVTVEYTLNGTSYEGTFTYSVSPPNQDLCDLVASNP